MRTGGIFSDFSAGIEKLACLIMLDMEQKSNIRGETTILVELFK
jgi:hypothetical protein